MIIIFVGAILFLTIKYSYGTVVDTMTNNTMFSQDQIAVDALEDTKELTNRFDYALFAILIGFTFAILIAGWFAGGHPLFAFIYFIALVLLVAVSAVFSYVWYKVSNLNMFLDTVSTFPIIDLILTNFPIYIAIVGFLGMLVMFAKPAFTQ